MPVSWPSLQWIDRPHPPTRCASSAVRSPSLPEPVPVSGPVRVGRDTRRTDSCGAVPRARTSRSCRRASATSEPPDRSSSTAVGGSTSGRSRGTPRVWPMRLGVVEWGDAAARCRRRCRGPRRVAGLGPRGRRDRQVVRTCVLRRRDLVRGPHRLPRREGQSPSRHRHPLAQGTRRIDNARRGRAHR